jgi:hypothetical protein
VKEIYFVYFISDLWLFIFPVETMVCFFKKILMGGNIWVHMWELMSSPRTFTEKLAHDFFSLVLIL